MRVALTPSFAIMLFITHLRIRLFVVISLARTAVYGPVACSRLGALLPKGRNAFHLYLGQVPCASSRILVTNVALVHE